ncbi:hypothetical protein HOK22_05310, partial [Candidatus Peregrinibacteria bacterium]|nr:hypothetical protein [Candidatus Peregrinibacteria bacterium]
EATNEAVRRFYLTAIRTLEGLEGDECTAGKLTALRNALNDDQASLKEPAELSYGISDLEEHTPEAGYMALMEAEQAANINKLRRESQHGPERDNLQEYSDLHLFSDLARAQRTLQKDMIVDGKIRPNWTKFYYLDDKGYVRMQAAALVAYRKFSGDYSTLSDRNAEKFTYFGKYYDAINVIDVIKVPYTDAYEKRVEKVVGLIKKIQDCLNEAPTKGFVTMSESQALKTARQKHLLTLIGQAIAELEVDMKDQGQGLTKTKAAFIKALCAGGAKAITFADICGFGAINTQEMEADVIEIFEELGLNFAEMKSAANDEWADHVESQIASADPIKLKELRKKMCDEGSEFIRGTEIDLDKKLNSGDGCSDASGGDELNRVDKIDDLEKAADAFADRARAIIDEDKLPVRIATVFTDLDFSKGPVETMRAKIIQLISFIKWGEDMHSNLKAANNSDYNDSIRTKREKMVA